MKGTKFKRHYIARQNTSDKERKTMCYVYKQLHAGASICASAAKKYL